MIYSPVKVTHDRIKDALQEWASFMKDKKEGGYPKSSAFANERVQSCNASDAYYANIPDRVIQLDKEIEHLPPMYKRMINLEYMDRRPQKTKAGVLGMPRETFSRTLVCIYTVLDYAVFGVSQNSD